MGFSRPCWAQADQGARPPGAPWMGPSPTSQCRHSSVLALNLPLALYPAEQRLAEPPLLRATLVCVTDTKAVAGDCEVLMAASACSHGTSINLSGYQYP